MKIYAYDDGDKKKKQKPNMLSFNFNWDLKYLIPKERDCFRDIIFNFAWKTMAFKRDSLVVFFEDECFACMHKTYKKLCPNPKCPVYNEEHLIQKFKLEADKKIREMRNNA